MYILILMMVIDTDIDVDSGAFYSSSNYFLDKGCKRTAKPPFL